MRLLLVLLLTAALSTELAHALQCHWCRGFGGCIQKATCPQSSTHCISVATRLPFSHSDLPLVRKYCANSCPDIQSLGLGPKVSIACCQANLCNED
ncbi:secreted Ly-6/uPAR domain-containing protein 2-like isoform 2-T2 [Dugong dugon]